MIPDDETQTTPPQPRGAQADAADDAMTLTVIEHDELGVTGARHTIDSDETLLGRAADAVLPGVLDGGLASRRHARVVWTGATWRLEDLGSRNGTRVNGNPVSEHALQPGDIIEIGGVLLMFHVTPRHFRSPPIGAIVAISAAMGHVYEQIELVSRHDTTVIVRGETGVGKELVAQQIHRRSGRTGSLVALNCAGLPDTLLHSELFGHVRGAFTSADRKRDGLIESARAGTLFLDELTDASPMFQATLLRMLETRRYRPVGADLERETDTRIIAAVQPRVAGRLEDGSFRWDLWTRLEQWLITVPPLRERPEDVPILVRHLLSQALGRDARLATGVLVRLVRQRWPGNVRELKSFVERVAVASSARASAARGPIEVPAWLFDERREEAASTPAPPGGATAGPASRRRAVKAPTPCPSAAELEALLATHEGSVRAAAASLAVERKTLYRWLARAGLDPDRYRADG